MGPSEIEKNNKPLLMDFTEGSITKKMIVFAAPLFLSNLLQAVYNLVDMIIVGQAIGKSGISAVSIGGELLAFLTFIAMGFSNAGQVIISQNIGAGRKNRVHLIVGNLFTFLFISSIILSIISLLLHNVILSWMSTPIEAFDNASDYFWICSFGLVFIYGYNAVSAIMRGMGDSKRPFLFVGIAALLNVALDLAFVFGFGMGAKGAALATVISQAVSFFLGLIYIIAKRKQLELEFHKDSFIPCKEAMEPILKLGFPMALKSASITFSKLFVASWINSFGIIASSVAGIESKFNIICNLFANAINVAGGTMIGQNIGAEKYDRVPKILRSAFGIVFTVDAIFIIFFLIFPETAFGIFTSDPEIIAACLTMIPVIIIMFASSCARCPFNGLIDGSGNYKLNLLTALIDGIFARIGFALLFGVVFKMGWIGFLYGDVIAGFTPFVLGLPYLLSGKWRTRKYLIK